MRGRTAGVLVMIGALMALAFAAPASADDAQLWATYTADNPEINRVGPQWERAVKRFERNPRRYYRSVVRTSNRLAELSAGVAAQFEPVQPSSSTGTKVKELVLLELRELQRGYRLIATAAKGAVRGRRSAIGQAKRADEAFARAGRYDRRALRGFKALGFSR
jgi:hypothetical protein